MSQKQRLLYWFQEGNTIDRMSSYNRLGIIELSARVVDLEKAEDGH